ncbi:caspase-1-like isoform X2 [Solenopsis invicta]|uniref:caspase-1-like isoform X2 n=1 Tax=Solenopsis invicta TaxID=13686 RepID=UPI00193E183B|nr:caspase-1-like isoform X2 [Solenopsis invicta]
MESAIDEAEVQTSLQQNKPEMNTDLCTITKTSQSNEKKDAVDALPYPVPLKPDQECLPTAAMPVHKNANCYNMNHKNRGKCIIFNHEEFDLSEFAKREGSTYDTLRLQNTFQYLDFDVEIYENLTYNQIMDVIEKDDDMLVAKNTIYESEMLWKPFTADKCVTLAGKPKLFFIQACRGNKTDSGILLTHRRVIPNMKMNSGTDTLSSYTIPTHADFLIAHSSVQGFVNWRDLSTGTWYIQSLCDVLDEHGTEMELMNMLTITAQKVATNFVSVHDNYVLHNKKQIPSVTSMLTRLVYFPQKSVTNSGKSYCRLL